MSSRARCAYYNGHSAPKLETAILDYLGQYSDPKKVRELLDASEKQEVRRRGTELKQVERRLAEVEADFAKNLTLLKREVLDEDEFRKANEARRDERTRLTGRQTELTEWLAQQHERLETVGSLPTRVRSFLKDFEALDVRRAKALLQTILLAAHVHRDGRILHGDAFLVRWPMLTEVGQEGIPVAQAVAVEIRDREREGVIDTGNE